MAILSSFYQGIAFTKVLHEFDINYSFDEKDDLMMINENFLKILGHNSSKVIETNTLNKIFNQKILIEMTKKQQENMVRKQQSLKIQQNQKAFSLCDLLKKELESRNYYIVSDDYDEFNSISDGSV